MAHVDGRVRCGELEVEIHCDTHELDAAIAKLDTLLTKATQAQEHPFVMAHGVLPAGMLAVGLASRTGVTRKISRRRLFDFLRP
jgi:hypothetical protein